MVCIKMQLKINYFLASRQPSSVGGATSARPEVVESIDMQKWNSPHGRTGKYSTVNDVAYLYSASS